MAIGFPSYYGVHAFIYGVCALICSNVTSFYPVTLTYCADQKQAIEYASALVAYHGRELLYCYLTCFVLAFLTSVLSWYFNKYYLPSDFATLGKIRGGMGGILRISNSVLTVVSWVLLPLIAYSMFMS